MRSREVECQWTLLRTSAVLLLRLSWILGAMLLALAQPVNVSEILGIEGTVETAEAGTDAWRPAQVGKVIKVGDRLRTAANSRATLRNLETRITSRVGARTLLEIQPPQRTTARATFSLWQGLLYFFSRDRPENVDVRTPTITGAIRGTEFNLEVAADGTSVITMIEGEVDLDNNHGQLQIRSGEQATAAPGAPPVKTAAVLVQDIIQWALYYPGVVDLAELALDDATLQELATSLDAYRAGDLLGALAAYPRDRQPTSNAEKIFRAALVLAVGEVPEAERLMESLTDPIPTAEALRRMIRVVKGDLEVQPLGKDLLESPSLWLVESYILQSRRDLDQALEAAQKAVALSPRFGFAWTRVAELEFGFGRTRQTAAALDTGLQASPRNAQAIALRGFVLAAQGRLRTALEAFDLAISLDPALANGWLGRGLCRIRQGQTESGLLDLQVAATVEPQRAMLRSYLAKALSLGRDRRRALTEIELAERLDPGDPTAWLYAALIRQEANRINEAVADLEQSKELNDHRSLYRSRLLLDQDRGVRGANLATLYGDAGLSEVSLWEAGRAVTADYANFSAHLFLANSYYEMRDPRQVNIRYETPWLSEYLIGNLLAPASAGTLSPQISQHEYGRLFERNRLGLLSNTKYSSHGDWAQGVAHLGIFSGVSYAIDGTWRSEHGYRPNSDFEQTTASVAIKQEFGAQDSLFLQATYYHAESGDVAPYYDNVSPFPGLRIEEEQEPLLMLGYHHEWSPGVRTLFLGGRLPDRVQLSNPSQPLLEQLKVAPEDEPLALPAQEWPTAPVDYESDLLIYSAELQQIVQKGDHTLVFGARYQTGEMDILEKIGASTPTSFANNDVTSAIEFWSDPLTNSIASGFDRITAYGYYTWRVMAPLQLTAGLTYDYLGYPLNYNISPASPHTDTLDRFSPKAGVLWQPSTNLTLRAAYARALGGMTFEQSYRLEPTAVAGFNQAYRGLIPTEVNGASSGECMDTLAAAADLRLPSRTYLGLQALWLRSDLNRLWGAVDLVGVPPATMTSSSRQVVDYAEEHVTASIYQLLGNCWSLGTAYRITFSDYEMQFPQLIAFDHFAGRMNHEATLHQVGLFALFNHPSGVFARCDAVWRQQSNRGYEPDLPGDEFWQVSAQFGYRFWRRKAEVGLALLNLLDEDYRLNPISLVAEPPRERTLTVSFRLNL